MQDLASELPRIPILRASVHRLLVRFWYSGIPNFSYSESRFFPGGPKFIADSLPHIIIARQKIGFGEALLVGQIEIESLLGKEPSWLDIGVSDNLL
jgi:hypothetical protein